MSKLVLGELERKIKILPFLLFLILLLPSCNGRVDVYYVNPSLLLQGYHGAVNQHELFQVKARDWQQRIDSLGTELDALSKAPASIREAK